MKLSTLCATGYACSGVNRQDAGQQNVETAFKQANIPQDLSIRFNPEALLDVAYPQASGGIGTFRAGDLVPRSATQQTPLFAVRGLTDPGPYVLAMVDPDAPTPQDPTVSQIRHYLAGDFMQQPFNTDNGMFYTNGMSDDSDERMANNGGMGRNGGVGNNGGMNGGGMGRNNGVDNNGGIGRNGGFGNNGGMDNGGMGNGGGVNNGGMGGNGGMNNNNGVQEQQLVSQTAPVTDYLQPSPPSGSDAHRYVFLLFRQPDGFNDQQIVTPSTSRLNFNISAFAEAVGLGDPLAGTFMLVAPDS